VTIKKRFIVLICIFVFVVGIFSYWFIKSPSKISNPIFPIASVPVKKCPDGFIKVNDFCVMKYDAKCSNTDPKCVTSEGVYKNDAPGCACEGKYRIVSQPEGSPITFIPEDDGTKTSAKAYCQNMGWHLMTNPEWMEIANDVASVSANWCSQNGTDCGNPPGASGKILANGHNDSSPNKALPAGPDNEPCYQTVTNGSNACGEKGSQKRTLELSNGQIIWDFAGNVWQWIDTIVERKNEPRSIIPGLGNIAWTWAEFQTVPESSLYSPPDKTWSSKNGVGRIYHYNSIGDTDTTLYTFIRGGNWRHGYDSGVFTIHMQPVPGKTGIDDVGFRCTVSPN
jgi:hypothetical protein